MSRICTFRKMKLVTALYKDLRKHGYKRKSATFIRQPSPDFIQVVSVSVKTLEYPDVCTFVVNLGVYLPVLHDALPVSFGDYYCDFQTRLHVLENFDPDLPDDITEISQKIIRLFHQHGQPWLDRCSSYESIRRELAKPQSQLSLHGAIILPETRTRITAFLAKEGDA
jgi:hypothetical protein